VTNRISIAQETGRAGLVVTIGLLGAALCTGARAEEEASGAAGARDRINYSVGYEFGGYLAELKRGGTGVELEAVFKGVLDALSGTEARFSKAEMRAALSGLEGTRIAAESGKEADAQRPRLPARTRGFMDDFAALNAKREGVTTLPSGVQYEVLRVGKGKRPGPMDRVAVQYEGTLTTGVVFDTTYEDEEPPRLRMDEIAVPGLKEALLLMQEGAEWRIVVPPSMGFGASGNNQLRRRDLIYKIELVAVEPAAEGPAPQADTPGPGVEAGDAEGRAPR
jgi:FKBP-type peptidyl-prolyl cis-trans isomerase FklB